MQLYRVQTQDRRVCCPKCSESAVSRMFGLCTCIVTMIQFPSIKDHAGPHQRRRLLHIEIGQIAEDPPRSKNYQCPTTPIEHSRTPSHCQVSSQETTTAIRGPARPRQNYEYTIRHRYTISPHLLFAHLSTPSTLYYDNFTKEFFYTIVVIYKDISKKN